MSYNTQETSEIRVSSKIDRTALSETLLRRSWSCSSSPAVEIYGVKHQYHYLSFSVVLMETSNKSKPYQKKKFPVRSVKPKQQSLLLWSLLTNNNNCLISEEEGCFYLGWSVFFCFNSAGVCLKIYCFWNNNNWNRQTERRLCLCLWIGSRLTRNASTITQMWT